jgi:hypothetical protein
VAQTEGKWLVQDADEMDLIHPLKRKKVKIPLHGVDLEILGRNIRGFHFLLDKKRRLERTL